MTFDEAFDRLIGHEGGYSNRDKAADPGGETNWGISKRSYPDVDIPNLTREGAKAIYQRDFWAPLLNVHPAVKFQAFDFAVNSGIQTAIRKLQKAINVADDGHWGPISDRKVSMMDLSDVLMLYIAEREEFWASLSNFPQKGRGWMRRSAQNLRYAAMDN